MWKPLRTVMKWDVIFLTIHFTAWTRELESKQFAWQTPSSSTLLLVDRYICFLPPTARHRLSIIIYCEGPPPLGPAPPLTPNHKQNKNDELLKLAKTSKINQKIFNLLHKFQYPFNLSFPRMKMTFVYVARNMCIDGHWYTWTWKWMKWQCIESEIKEHWPKNCM